MNILPYFAECRNIVLGTFVQIDLVYFRIYVVKVDRCIAGAKREFFQEHILFKFHFTETEQVVFNAIHVHKEFRQANSTCTFDEVFLDVGVFH